MRHLSKVKSFYSYSNFENVIHGFIAIPLDYCNALYVCVSHANFHSSNWVKMLLLACLERIAPFLACLHSCLQDFIACF